MKGVVHVGAHKGEEIDDYLRDGRSPIVCFEPLPFEHPYTVNVALGDQSGRMTLRVPRHLHDSDQLDTQSASGLRLIPERARAIGWTPTVDPVEHEVRVVRFDSWAENHGFTRGSCDLLVIDVQGMELQVLRGFGDHLKDFQEIIVECSEPALYEGGASASEVVRFLREQGFTQMSPVVAHGDIRFTRVSAQSFIILPVVVGAAMTRDCIASLRAQDSGNVRIHVIDNGSEGCSPLLRTLAGSDLTVTTYARRRGLNHVWNAALRHAFEVLRMDRVLVVNNDTIIRPETFRVLHDADEMFVTAVGSNDRACLNWPLNDLTTRRPHPDFSCFMIKRECWEKVGSFDEEMNAYAADGDMHLRMHQLGIRAVSLPIPFYHIASGTLKQASARLREEICAEAERDREYFRAKWGCDVGSEAYYAMFKEEK